ncbi:polysaccharide biosynthesis C-terminal domain-containing protein [Methylobacterium sp. J-059]|nr:polysaccharide biosynthesis C-terminal domain-containing protein [Methylobacterium sp. J-059]
MPPASDPSASAVGDPPALHTGLSRQTWRSRIETTWIKARSTGAGYPLIDQAIVSLGTFVLNIMLARHLPPSEYGHVSILFGVLFLLQVVNTTLVFYPMTVRCSVALPDKSRALIHTSLLILVPLSIPLCIGLAVVNLANGRADLALAAIAYFLCWQFQEYCRRALFAELRFRDAILGDAISYLGQTSVVVSLFWFVESLSMSAIFWVMALTSAVAACVQARQARLTLPNAAGLAGTWQDFWQIGRYALTSNVLGITRFQILSWTLALASGAGSTASYQAALNVLNVANPVLFALLNLIPQLAARAHLSGRSSAWNAARNCALLGAPVIFALYCSALIEPRLILSAFYGAGSPYLDLTGPVRVLVLAFMAGYATEAVCSFLHGIDAPRTAVVINGIGVAISIVVGLPLIILYGVMGAAAATLISAIARLVASHMILKRMLLEDRVGQVI